MMQDVQQGQHVLPVSPPLGRADVIHNDVADELASMRPAQQILRVRGSSDLRHVLVLGNRKHLLFGNSAKGQAIFERDHGGRRLRRLDHHNSSKHFLIWVNGQAAA